MELKKIILHQIIREKNEVPSLNLSKHLLSVGETTNQFVHKLVVSYRKKNPTYGIFQDNEELYPFQKKVREYLTEKDFIKFSSDSMRILKKEIDVSQATGGYVVFIHYIEKQIEYIITVMLDKSTQFSVDDSSLDISMLETLDVDKVARANRININKLQDEEEQYLSFIKGTRDVSVYFQKFIENTDLTSSRKNANNLKIALKQYLRDNEYDEETKTIINNELRIYTNNQTTKDEDVKLEAISAIVNSSEPSNFITYIQGHEELEVSGSFRGKKRDFDFFYRTTITENGYKLQFDKELLKNKKIEIDGNRVIINDVPDQIIQTELNGK